jgi:hypothetical protein
MGWRSIRNGELLALAASRFEVFVTVDRNLSFQQNLDALPLTIVVLRAPTNRLVDLRMLANDLNLAIRVARPGLVIIGDS